MSVWLGLDLGSSSAKAVVADDAGTVQWRATEQYPDRGGPSKAGREPEALLLAVRALVTQCNLLPAISGVGLVGYMPALVCVGGDGKAIRPILDWRDPGGVGEAEELAADLGDPADLVGGALPWSAAYAPARLLWLARHEPNTVRQTRWVLQPKDYVGFRLTGSPASDPWSSRGLCHLRTGAPVHELLSRVGWPDYVVPPIRAAWEARGVVSREGAALSGLPPGLPVSVGWADGLAAMLGAGVFAVPTAFVTSGTADVIGVTLEEEPAEAGPLLNVPATCAPRPLLFGPTQAGGGSLAWLAGLLGRTEDDCVRLAGAAQESTEELPVFVPYVAGERAPIWRTDVRGLYLGLSARHGAAELARGTLLGVGFSARHVLESALGTTGDSAGPVRVAGAAAADPVWRDLRLHTLGRTLEIVAEPQVTALGAAMLGACAAGANLQQLLARLRTPISTHVPSSEQLRRADRGYARYLQASAISLGFASRNCPPEGGLAQKAGGDRQA